MDLKQRRAWCLWPFPQYLLRFVLKISNGIQRRRSNWGRLELGVRSHHRWLRQRFILLDALMDALKCLRAIAADCWRATGGRWFWRAGILRFAALHLDLTARRWRHGRHRGSRRDGRGLEALLGWVRLTLHVVSVDWCRLCVGHHLTTIVSSTLLGILTAFLGSLSALAAAAIDAAAHKKTKESEAKNHVRRDGPPGSVPVLAAIVRLAWVTPANAGPAGRLALTLRHTLALVIRAIPIVALGRHLGNQDGE